ncbi:hypothetical protein A3A35_00260 [Candidatus Kaiserbacteria bacterium RIFCSPLOWO2_01_FULL_51_21]|uniref:LamG-like jellyroll fold domain-containing protein n=1 Tax=Candidatus Kaiserbacteria bacterium RIFCSPLOWO2_01_FULL_51_21 TaxID=1798508 RepID=A0A1F6ECF9_9BACT|nr:MAG: hypothetical protein A3A35_00260 [Candidatus Kaiserbacteria bacterium RIFCSPLOWO2_01_FULL_51_21]
MLANLYFKFFLTLLVLGIIAYGIFWYQTRAGTTINVSIIPPDSASTLDDSLVGWWTFDGKNLIQNAADSSGKGNPGYLTSFTSTTTVPGKLGQALALDGVDDQVNFGDKTQFEFASGESWTISMWFYPMDGTGSDKGIITKGYSEASENNMPWYLLAWNESTGGCTAPNITFYIRATGSINAINCKGSLPINTWYHIVNRYDASSATLYFYLNGVLEDTATGVTANAYGTNTSALILGRFFAGHTKSSADDLRIWNRALSAAEVQQLYSFGATAKAAVTLPSITDGLLGWWTFDGKNLIQNAADSSGQGNTGYLTNFNSTTTAPGALGQALLFDGVNDSVSNIRDVGSIKTVTFWMKTATTTANASMIDTGIVAGGGTIETNSGGTITATSFTSPTIYVDGSSASALIPDLKWHHVAVTTNTAESGAGFIIGKATSLNFGGSLDDVRIWNRALSGEEVNRLYHLGATTKISVTLATNSDLQNGLVGHWTFDGKNLIQNAADSSGQGNTGYLTSFTSTTTAPGKLGQALSFDGGNDYVQTNASLQSANDFTLSTWMKATSTAFAEHVLWEGGAGENGWGLAGGVPPETHGEMHLSLGSITDGGVSGNGLSFFLGFQNNAGTLNAIYSGFDLTNQWAHIIVVVRESGGGAGTPTVGLYVNGVLVASDTGTVAQTDRSLWDTKFRIGQSDVSTRFFGGSLDDVRIWNRALSPEEIKRLYELGK